MAISLEAVPLLHGCMSLSNLTLQVDEWKGRLFGKVPYSLLICFMTLKVVLQPVLQILTQGREFGIN